jgi:NAD(P)-dependent dehydrogenase (short-subunit alcohol dehydrogenase family)
MDLLDRVCLVTGGTSGIGAATALTLAKRGADIAVLGSSGCRKAEELKQQVIALGCRFYCAAGDVAQPDECRRFVEEAARALGGVDVLVHSAGGLIPAGFLEVDPKDWYRAFDVHVHAAFHLCRAVVPFMQKKSRGAIVLISSAAGLRGCKGATAYGVVKGAIPQFVRAVARELADFNIRVNAVAPGVIRTPLQDGLTAEQVSNNLKNRIPLHREGTAQDVADAIALLITNEFMTGETVTVDGGMTMRIV